jgi:hypothetical protein
MRRRLWYSGGTVLHSLCLCFYMEKYLEGKYNSSADELKQNLVLSKS